MIPLFQYPSSWSEIRAVDIFDILLVTFFAYSAIVWFRQARSRFVLIGLGIMAVLYALARLLDMRVTLLLFQTGITVALVAVVIIFQEEIRRFFERLATTEIRGRGEREEGWTELSKILVEATDRMAQDRTGALIVLKGKEPLERHLDGGLDLDGKPSPALLYSIFDDSSAGHDGAVVIEGGVIRKFGAHLPLSTAVEGDAPFGTRHTAALGLAERSDAFVIVVSEERGEISVGRHGRLNVVASPAELRGRLKVFFREMAPPELKPWVRWVSSNPGAKLLALALALAAWLVVYDSEGGLVSMHIAVPIGLRDLPEGVSVEDIDPAVARVTLTGPERSFQGVDTTRLVVLARADKLRPGSQSVPIEEADIQLPPGLELASYTPRTVTLVVPDRVTKEVTVRVVTRGRPQPPLRLVEVSAVPEKITLLVPRDQVEAIKVIRTEPVDLSEIRETTSVRRALVLQPDLRLPREASPTVEVRIKLAPRRQGRADPVP